MSVDMLKLESLWRQEQLHRSARPTRRDTTETVAAAAGADWAKWLRGTVKDPLVLPPDRPVKRVRKPRPKLVRRRLRPA
jgi:hypothetical protein